MQHVLVIDDDADIREAVERALRRHNFEVTTAKDGAEGLEKMRSHAPDAILVDLIMPVMNGATFLRESGAERAAAGIPVAVMSAVAASEPDLPPVQAILRKPFSLAELLAVVNDLTGGAEQRCDR